MKSQILEKLLEEREKEFISCHIIKNRRGVASQMMEGK